MKTKFFKTAKCRATTRVAPTAYWYCLLLLFLCPAVLSAQSEQRNGVDVSNLVVTPGSPATVTFDVSWDKNAQNMPELWSDTVWVFVDYNVSGKMERLPLSAGATLTATSAPGAGKVMEETGNNKGVWVVGNARTSGSFSATVQLLTATATVAGACVYASNYPPVGEYLSVSDVSFTGTPPYDIVFGDGSTYTIISNYYAITSGSIVSFTDKTGAPGMMKCMPMDATVDFSVPVNVPKSQQVSFSATDNSSGLDIAYSWSASGFNPGTYTGTPYVTVAPAQSGTTYPVTLTARSAGYCDKSVTKNVAVVDCPLTGRIGSGDTPCGNGGGKIGNI
jgi:hypothetical protein